MILANKKTGETPLEFLNRLRIERPEIKDSVLSYAGRLDPMAEGEMLVLVDNENKERQKYLGLDKEYEATFLFGISTDTGDVLGLIKDEDEVAEISFQEISAITESFLKIKSQKYPWFSSKTVFGIPLFEHFKKGNLDIERPTRSIEIKKLEVLEFNKISSEDLEKYIFDSVNKVNGDFRQSEILDSWRGIFSKKKSPPLPNPKNKTNSIFRYIHKGLNRTISNTHNTSKIKKNKNPHLIYKKQVIIYW